MGTYEDINPTPLNAAGWQQNFFDGFNGTSLDRDKWPVLYGGRVGNGAYTWTPDQVHVGNGELSVDMTRQADGSWHAGGLSQGWEGQTYGRFEVRAKLDQGQGTGGGIILWPTDNSWPPETDLLETPTGHRDPVVFSNHWEHNGPQYHSEAYYGIDASKWHTYAVDWQPDRLTYYIDGKKMYETTDHVPQKEMALGFTGFIAAQNDQWYGGGPNASTPDKVTLHIDWARISTATQDATAPDTGTPDGGTPDKGATPTPAPAPTPAPPDHAADGLPASYVPGSYTDAQGHTDWAAASAALFGTTNGQVDWSGIAAIMTANHEASGHWYL